MKKVLCVILIFCICLSGCKKKTENPANAPGITGDFTLAMRTPQSLDPLKTKQETNVLIFDLVYDSLVYVDREMRAVPYLAESCTVSQDGRTISFKLHEGVLWHDGAAFTASDVEYTINRIRSLGEEGIYYDRLKDVTDVTVRDMYHFDLHLAKPHITVLNLLDFPIVPCHRSDLDTTLVGTGQYKLESHTPQKNMTLIKNENWALAEPPAMERIYVKMIERSADAANMVKIGEVTAVASPMQSVGGLGIGENMAITHYPTLEFEFIGFNFSSPRLASYRVRYAVSYALDRQKIIDDVFLGYGSAACVPVPPASYMYIGAEKDMIQKDTEKAKALLFEEGYTLEGTIMQKVIVPESEEEEEKTVPLKLSLLVNEENSQRMKFANIIKENLVAVGMDVQIESVPFETYRERLYAGDFDMYIGGCEFSPDLTYDFMFGENPIAENGYVSSEMDNALSLLGVQRTDETIRAAYGQFQEVFLRDLPLCGICFLDGAFVHTASLKGIEALASSKLYRNIGKWYLE